MMMALVEHQVFTEDEVADAKGGETTESDESAFDAAVEAIDAYKSPEEILKIFQETAETAGDSEGVQAEEFAAIEATLKELLGDDYTPQRLDDLLADEEDE